MLSSTDPLPDLSIITSKYLKYFLSNDPKSTHKSGTGKDTFMLSTVQPIMAPIHIPS